MIAECRVMYGGELRAQRGRPREPDRAHKLRGTYKARHKAPVEKPRPIVRRKPFRATAKQIEHICRTGIPGYDPWRKRDGYTFDATRARAACKWFNDELAHLKGAHAREGFALETWQLAIVGNLYGWTNARGLRRYQEAFVYVPRKNGKTTIAAGLILHGLFEDGEPGAEIYGAAYEFKQASLVFEHARGMVALNESLAARCKVYGATPTSQSRAIQLTDDVDYSTYRVVCGKADQAHGFSTHMAVIDELHNQPDRHLVDAILTSTGARTQPLVVMITTADWKRESICNEKYEYACQVRDGILDDPRFLPVIYEAVDGDDWRDREVWRKANPNLDVSVSMETLEREFQRALDVPAYENTFKRLHLNMRTSAEAVWLNIDRWETLGDLDVNMLRGRPCFAGLDMSSTKDLTALSLVFPLGARIAVLPFFWAPLEGARARERADRVPYEAWSKAGHVTLTEGDVVDYDVVRRDVNKLNERYEIRAIAIDRWNSQQLQTQLDGDGFEIVPFGQGFASMSEPAKRFESLILGEDVTHAGHPILTWCLANTTVDMDAAGNIKPTKKKSTGRIDGAVATIMGVGLWIADVGPQKSVYSKRGLVTL